MSWFLEALKKYAVFSGRARRKEYWMFVLFYSIIYAVVLGIGVAAKMPALIALPVLALLLPGWGVTVRRLHDTGRSGWWILLGIVPLVGPIVLLVFSATEGEAGPNKYGPNPKEAPALV
ncbi:DUF805 domain-containing protein [Streptomyces sp. L2]|uniref:DUF805 domain-containing protein n=1 Tax=Streptomyces sp. L2 TaxID=2162665 RepID=UPI001011A969|nr:DUF805 domain-containing protein [Streptomyces sp. L2]